VLRLVRRLVFVVIIDRPVHAQTLRRNYREMPTRFGRGVNPDHSPVGIKGGTLEYSLCNSIVVDIPILELER